jgi:RHS repeat-associated protein
VANWHRNANRVAVYQPQYNRRGVLQAEDLSIGALWNDGHPSGAQKAWTAVHGITYNAKGQRTRLRYGNGTETRYAYDERSFRLTQIRTTRPATDLPFPGFRSNLANERVVQQLLYTYDAAGNIAEIEDQAWAPVFFRNQAVESRNLYVVDAMARLIEATGRESAALSGAPNAQSLSIGVDAFPVETADQALRNYRQRYVYDAVGNFSTMQHAAGTGSWTRRYESATDSNRLLRTWTGADRWDDTTATNKVAYAYDTHGSMLNLASVADADRIRWDWRDMIEGMDLGGGGHAWYAYDIGKQRTRKRIERLGGAWEERLYLGGMELYRRYGPSGEKLEEIESQHLFVGDQRVLLVDDVIDTDNAHLGTGVLCKYQYSNHLGSVALELDDTVRIVSCEELHPYGTTAYHLHGRGVRATTKRYRYTGMERDDESGLSHHTARYYLPWLSRWSAADPAGLLDGTNVYSYSHCQPVSFVDWRGTQSFELPRPFVSPRRFPDVRLGVDIALRLDLPEPIETITESADSEAAPPGSDVTEDAAAVQADSEGSLGNSLWNMITNNALSGASALLERTWIGVFTLPTVSRALFFAFGQRGINLGLRLENALSAPATALPWLLSPVSRLDRSLFPLGQSRFSSLLAPLGVISNVLALADVYRSTERALAHGTPDLDVSVELTVDGTVDLAALWSSLVGTTALTGAGLEAYGLTATTGTALTALASGPAVAGSAAVAGSGAGGYALGSLIDATPTLWGGRRLSDSASIVLWEWDTGRAYDEEYTNVRGLRDDPE